MQDPSIPVHKKGVLMSFLTGQSIAIPEKDMARFLIILSMSMHVQYDLRTNMLKTCYAYFFFV